MSERISQFKEGKILIVIQQSINFMLAQYGVDFEYVIKNPILGGRDWFMYYSFKTKGDYGTWREFTLSKLQSVARLSKKTALKYFGAIDLNYGLTHEYEGDYDDNNKQAEISKTIPEEATS